MAFSHPWHAMASDQVGSLYGLLSLSDMGQRAYREPLPSKAAKTTASRPVKKAAGTASLNASLSEWAGIQYRPRTATSKQAWPLLLSYTAGLLDGEGSHELIVSAADVILDCLAEREGETEQQRQAVSRSLGQEIPLERFIPLLNLTRRFNDYRRKEQVQENMPMVEAEEEEGVAVVFAEDDDDDDNELVGEEEDEEEEAEDEGPVKVALPGAEGIVVEGLEAEERTIRLGSR